MWPWCTHFAGDRNAKKERNSTNTAAAASSNKHYFLEYLVCFLQEPADKKYEKEDGNTAAATYPVRITSRTLWTTHEQTGGGGCCKGPPQRGIYASLTCFFGLVATFDVRGTCPKLKLPLVLNLIQMGPRKNKSRTSEIPRAGRYTNIK